MICKKHNFCLSFLSGNYRGWNLILCSPSETFLTEKESTFEFQNVSKDSPCNGLFSKHSQVIHLRTFISSWNTLYLHIYERKYLIIDQIKLLEDSLQKFLGRPYRFKSFKGCLPKFLLGPFLNSLSHTFIQQTDVNLLCKTTFIWKEKLLLHKHQSSTGKRKAVSLSRYNISQQSKASSRAYNYFSIYIKTSIKWTRLSNSRHKNLFKIDISKTDHSYNVANIMVRS